MCATEAHQSCDNLKGLNGEEINSARLYDDGPGSHGARAVSMWRKWWGRWQYRRWRQWQRRWRQWHRRWRRRPRASVRGGHYWRPNVAQPAVRRWADPLAFRLRDDGPADQHQ